MHYLDILFVHPVPFSWPHLCCSVQCVECSLQYGARCELSWVLLFLLCSKDGSKRGSIHVCGFLCFFFFALCLITDYINCFWKIKCHGLIQFIWNKAFHSTWLYLLASKKAFCSCACSFPFIYIAKIGDVLFYEAFFHVNISCQFLFSSFSYLAVSYSNINWTFLRLF